MAEQELTQATATAASAAATETIEGPSDTVIIDALRTVYDPELGVNIVDLGLVYRLDIDENAEIQVYMTLTSPGCPVGPQIKREVTASLSTLEGISAVKVNFVFSPPWSPQMMSEDAKMEMGIFEDDEDE